MQIRDQESYLSLNNAYCSLYYKKDRVILIAHLLQFILAAVLVLILTLSVNDNFVYAFIYVPSVLLYSAIQVAFMKKSKKTFPQYHPYYQLACFIVLLITFVFLYLYIFNPTFKQTFREAQDCKIKREQRVILEDDTYLEKFQVLTVQFIFENKQLQGCGCGSDKNTESVFQTKIEPFKYISNDEMTALNVTTHVEKEDISKIKMPSWMCQSFKNYTNDLIDLEATVTTGSSQRKALPIEKCFFNIYGSEDAALESQEMGDYCSSSSSFIQVIFDKEPYYPPVSFALLIILILFPLFGFSLNWVLVIIICSLFKSTLRKENERQPRISALNRSNSSLNKIQPLNDSDSISFHLRNEQDLANIIQLKQCDFHGEGSKFSVKIQEELSFTQVEQKSIGINNPEIHYQSISPMNKKQSEQKCLSVDGEKISGKIIYSLPATKQQKKELPPIERDFNFENALRESIKQDLEDKRTHKKYLGTAAQKKKKPAAMAPNIQVNMEHSDYISSNQFSSLNFPTPILSSKLSTSPQIRKKNLKVSFKEMDLQSIKSQ